MSTRLHQIAREHAADFGSSPEEVRAREESFMTGFKVAIELAAQVELETNGVSDEFAQIKMLCTERSKVDLN